MLRAASPALAELITRWSVGGFTGLPPIAQLSSADINGTQGVYTLATGTIYLNADWLATATKEEVFAVLTEELGHDLDGLMNAADAHGDKGEYFAALLSGQVLSDAKKKAPQQITAEHLIASLLPGWHLLLLGWSADGRLSSAAQEALLLPGEPPALTDLITQYSAGEFGGLPPIVLLSSSDINGAMGAYALSTGTIYLNADWLATATKAQVFSVLTEELGHHLDGRLNAVDTPGDEGEYFAALLSGQTLSGAQKKVLRESSDSIIISPKSAALQAEAAVSIFTYQELNSATNGDVYSADGTQRAELVLEGIPFDLTGINTGSPTNFVVQIEGSRLDGSDNDFYVIRPGVDLILPAGTTLNDYAIDILEYGSSTSSFGRVYTGVYTGNIPFEDRTNLFWGFTNATGFVGVGTNYRRYDLSTGTAFLAIQAFRDNVTGFNRPDPYVIELSFVYKPAAVVTPRLSIGTLVANQAEGSSGFTIYTFIVKRTGLITGTSSVDWTLQGVGTNPAAANDFTAGTPLAGTIQFAANESEKTITIQVAGDAVFEPDEEFEIVLSGASAGTEIIKASQRATITNDDAPPSPLSIVATTAGNETGPVASVFTATRGGDLTAALIVNYSITGTAISGTDYSGLANGTLTFLAGSATAVLSIPTLN
ncbi:MAG: hypothetical protein NTW51_07105, partial [Cyanobacteria bacterium]|nr:hypothetical protein [Cyanobacteriota bacterium]